ncbi:hypothetical protein M5689_010988 [Euphorbia peplus]|nr:hypothetical protein M5689_010988 [Euphorbia peplus]
MHHSYEQYQIFQNEDPSSLFPISNPFPPHPLFQPQQQVMLPSWPHPHQHSTSIKQPPFWKQLSDEQHCEQHSQVNKSNLQRLGEDQEIKNRRIFDQSQNQKRRRKMKKKRKLEPNISATVGFVESLVKQVMDHQEMLHTNYLQVIERMDKERTQREEERRHHQSENYSREAITRAHEKSLALTREAQIVSYLEQITGQTIIFPLSQI